MIYIPTFLSPKNSTINPTIVNTFSCQINGNSCNKYRLKIYKNSDSTLIYDTTEITITTLYDKDTLSVTIPANTLVVATEYKWTIQVFEGTTSTTSGETFFKSYANPTISLNTPATISSKSFDFIGTYSHPQNIGIKKFKFLLYDVNDVILQDTGFIFSGKIHFLYNGLLNGTTDKIECIVVDQNDVQVSSGKQTFTVSYSQPSLNIKPNVELIRNKSAIKVSWRDGIQINGITSGTYSFVNDFISVGNHGFQLGNDGTLEYNANIPIDFTCIYKISASGVFHCEFDTNYTVGYDGERFYFNNNGITIAGLPRILPSSPFIIAIKPTYVIIKTDTFTETLKV